MRIVTFTDNSILNFGMHKGERLIDVPADYLLFISSNSGWNKLSPLGRYITSNMDVLKSQDNTNKNLRR